MSGTPVTRPLPTLLSRYTFAVYLIVYLECPHGNLIEPARNAENLSPRDTYKSQVLSSRAPSPLTSPPPIGSGPLLRTFTPKA